MSLRHALLITLQECPATGYEIAKGFDQSLGHFWQASHQQIYRELGKMLEEKLLRFKEVKQKGKPSKKIYRVTAAGKTELLKWLLTPSQQSPTRDALLMKVYAGYLMPVGELCTEMDRQRHAYQELLTTYKQIEEDIFQGLDSMPLQFQFAHLTLRYGILSVEAWLNWSDEVNQLLEKMGQSG